ncbi:MAG: hypothetical protein R2855_02655 [Thermomicrobiales bacterium]
METGYLAINGTVVAVLDLSPSSNAGDVWVTAGLNVPDIVTGRTSVVTISNLGASVAGLETGDSRMESSRGTRCTDLGTRGSFDYVLHALFSEHRSSVYSRMST